MSRQEKRSRMRMLPPRIQLQQRDALTGSYPTNLRFSTDGRTGNYKVKYDDTKIIDFTSFKSYSYDTSALFDYVIHYQNWTSDELIYETPTAYYFKQSMVGTPFDSTNNTEVKDINQNGTIVSNNWLESKKSIVTYPGSSQIHPNINLLLRFFQPIYHQF